MITVALPLYDMKDIAHLCYESLCNQETNVDWELIILEEEGGYGYPEKYIERLNCDVRYMSIPNRISLPVKWRTIALEAKGDSFIMCAGDNYYQPNLIQQSFEGLKFYDWYQSYRGHFHDFKTGKFVEYRLKALTGLEMAMSINLARKIPVSLLSIGIDKFIFKAVKPQNVGWNENKSCLETICTHGMNKISKKRGRLIRKVKPPFYECEHDLRDFPAFRIIEGINLNKYYWV